MLTLRKYLMFLLWKSPGGSNRYRSSSHKSRRKPDTHTHRFNHHGATHWCRGGFQGRMCLPSSSLRDVHTMSRQIFLSISTSASKNESTSSSVMSPAQRKKSRHSSSAPRRRSKVSGSLLCLSSLSARRSWAFLNTRK